MAQIVIAGIVKDNGKTLKRNIERLYKLDLHFEKVQFVFFENNSTDDTKEILDFYKNKDSNFFVLNEDLPLEKQYEIARARHRNGQPCRLEIIAYARNKVASFIKETCVDYDAVLLVDMDTLLISAKQTKKAIHRVLRDGFDCVSANGLTKRGTYRDAFAFRSKNFPFGPEFLGDYWWKYTVKKIQKIYVSPKLIPVYSAFGGAAVYKMSAFIASEYTALPSKDFFNEHKKLDFTFAQKKERERASSEPIANSNYTKPVVCEHVPFHYKMRSQGFNNFVIDTSWRLLFKD